MTFKEIAILIACVIPFGVFLIACVFFFYHAMTDSVRLTLRKRANETAKNKPGTETPRK